MKPKSSLVLIISLLVLLTKTQAQQGFEIGPAFQVQNTWMVNSEDFDAGPELDFSRTIRLAYGLNASYGFAPRHGIRAGVFFSQQGQKFVTSEEFTPLPKATSQILSEYIQVPFMYRYNGSLKLANSAFLLTVGPQFGWLQKASRSYLFRDSLLSTNPINEVRTDSDADAKSFLKSMDISALLGVGATMRFSKKLHMNAMLNLSYSISDVISNPVPGRSSTRNGVAGISVSFYYLFGGPEMAGPPK